MKCKCKCKCNKCRGIKPEDILNALDYAFNRALNPDLEKSDIVKRIKEISHD